MIGIFKTIKKKRNGRRISALWLLLIAIEFLCPLFGDEPTYAVNLPQKAVIISAGSSQNKSSTGDSLSATDSQKQQQVVCHDECLCHATAIPNFFVPTIKPTVVSGERLAFLFDNPIYSSLPPPFHPPKLS